MAFDGVADRFTTNRANTPSATTMTTGLPSDATAVVGVQPDTAIATCEMAEVNAHERKIDLTRQEDGEISEDSARQTGSTSEVPSCESGPISISKRAPGYWRPDIDIFIRYHKLAADLTSALERAADVQSAVWRARVTLHAKWSLACSEQGLGDTGKVGYQKRQARREVDQARDMLRLSYLHAAHVVVATLSGSGMEYLEEVREGWGLYALCHFSVQMFFFLGLKS